MFLKQVTNGIQVPATEDIVLTKKLLNREYNIRCVGDNFKRLLLGKTLKGAPAQTLAVHQPTQYLTNQQIANELGDKAITHLSHALLLVKQQHDGKNGHLLTNSYANLIVVEVEEENGKKSLWLVHFFWGSGHRRWVVTAFSVEDPFRWSGGDQVLSRDS